jgi:hypothetical protein
MVSSSNQNVSQHLSVLYLSVNSVSAPTKSRLSSTSPANIFLLDARLFPNTSRVSTCTFKHTSLQFTIYNLQLERHCKYLQFVNVKQDIGPRHLEISMFIIRKPWHYTFSSSHHLEHSRPVATSPVGRFTSRFTCPSPVMKSGW